MRELIRRPSVPSLVTLAAVVGVIAVVIWQLDPGLLLANTATTGGDTGAHYGLAQFLKTSLLPHGHVTGWDPGAYDGFPLYSLYFPLPDAIAALLGYVVPFDIAFKFATILGSITLPVAAWAFGRLAGLERPRPAVLALFTLPFLFNQTFTIYGGNLYSTLAGEYSFSFGLSIALVFLGTAIRGMRTGQYRVRAALLLGACVLCHVVPTFFALAGMLVIFVLYGPSWRRAAWMVAVAVTAFLLVAWWAVPFVAQQAYSTTMGWQNVTTFVALLAPGGERWALALAVVGIVAAVLRRERAPLVLVPLAVASALVFAFEPQSSLYNTRVVPLWWLSVYLLAGYAVAEMGVVIARLWRRLREALQWTAASAAGALGPSAIAPAGHTPAFATAGASPWSPGSRPLFTTRTDIPPVAPAPPAPGISGTDGDSAPAAKPWPGSPGVRPWRPPPWVAGAVSVPLLAAAIVGAIVLPDLLVTPGTSQTHIGPLPVHIQKNAVPEWAQWNYSGMERKPAWPELHDGVFTTMDKVAGRYGCGRAMWEYNANLNRFGTPMALMLLPNFTGGCVQSLEGLLFESSTTTPWHFINQAELSAQPSEAMVSSTTGITYGPLDVPLGVQHLQLLGVRYFMASSPSVQQQAAADPDLTLVASTGPWRSVYQGGTLATTWKIYEVRDSQVVSPLTLRPDVLTGVGAGQAAWLPVAQRWYAQPSRWSLQLVVGGLPSWTRAPGGIVPGDRHPLPPVVVSNVRTGTDQVSFHVNRTGVPVLVKVSYYPDWHASGAQGPWRAEPNLMVVVPTSHDVMLTYGSSPAGTLGLILTVVGVVVVVLAAIRRRVLH